MDFSRLIKRFRQFGGIHLLREYAKIGVGGTCVKGFFQCLAKGQSFKTMYPLVLQKIEPYLAKKYYGILLDRKAYYRTEDLGHNRSNFIWFCWLQGMEKAPEMVRLCYDSLKGHLDGREIRIIDEKNWTEYVDLPDFVARKWCQGYIPPALFSDLLRLELLIKYGGTWIDSTVLCTGARHTREYLDSDLFLFQYSPKGTTSHISISNWFITACTNNEVLMVLRDMLYAYWKDYDCTLNYYIFHHFFSLISREYPERIASMPYGSSQRSIALMRHWNDTFDQGRWERLVNEVSFHKLSYRVDKKVREKKSNYYNWVLNPKTVGPAIAQTDS